MTDILMFCFVFARFSMWKIESGRSYQN